MRDIFLEKLLIKCGEETSSRSFPKNQKLSISLDQQLKVCTICFFVCLNSGPLKNIETKVHVTCLNLM